MRSHKANLRPRGFFAPFVSLWKRNPTISTYRASPASQVSCESCVETRGTFDRSRERRPSTFVHVTPARLSQSLSCWLSSSRASCIDALFLQRDTDETVFSTSPSAGTSFLLLIVSCFAGSTDGLFVWVRYFFFLFFFLG